MHEHWTVIGGWGTAPEVLRPVFGGNATYIDVNNHTSALLSGGELAPDWRERFSRDIQSYRSDTGYLACWSTGAILALCCASLFKCNALVLISATPSFCRNGTYRFGIHHRTVRSMQEKLLADRETVLRDFYRRCGIPETSGISGRWTSEQLSDGLDLLMQVSLDRHETASCPPLFVHGTRDAIIPFAAGQYLQEQSDCTMLALDAPHACFINNEETIKSAILHYLEGIGNEPV